MKKFVLKPKGSKFVSFKDDIKEILKTHSYIEFEFKGGKFAIITFDDFLTLLDFWKKGK